MNSSKGCGLDSGTDRCREIRWVLKNSTTGESTFSTRTPVLDTYLDTRRFPRMPFIKRLVNSLCQRWEKDTIPRPQAQVGNPY